MTKIGWIVAIILAVAIIGAGVGVYFSMNNQPAPVAETALPEQPVEQPANPQGDAMAAVEVTASAQTSTTVTYTDAGFTPAKVFIKKGDAVQFINKSTHTMWVGVDDHPTHTEYDGTSTKEHCAAGKNLNGSFDQCVGSSPGTTYTYTFTKAGTFDYHNHTASKDSGSVVVE